MSILKSEQILADSTKSWEDAASNAVARFSKTVRNVKSANVNNLGTVVKGGKIVAWRVNLQITFEVDAATPKRAAKKK